LSLEIPTTLILGLSWSNSFTTYYKLLSVRSFVCFVRDELLYDTEGSDKEKFQSLASGNSNLLKKWKIDENSYTDVYVKLMRKLNENAHPFFDTEDNFILNEDDFERERN
jgi:hypothetical protein